MNNNEKSKLSSFLEDNSGGFSAARLMALLWCGGVFVVWAATTVYTVVTSVGTTTPTFTMMTIPNEVITVMLGFMGLKVVQRFGEKGDVVQVEKLDPENHSVETE
jgi:hypothetical protein